MILIELAGVTAIIPPSLTHPLTHQPPGVMRFSHSMGYVTFHLSLLSALGVAGSGIGVRGWRQRDVKEAYVTIPGISAALPACERP